jgi:hypothetical protein
LGRRFFVHEDKETIAKAVDFLPGRFEWARRLRLFDTCRFDVDPKARKIYAGGGISTGKRIFAHQICNEFLFQISANCLAVRNPEKAGFVVCALALREEASFTNQRLTVRAGFNVAFLIDSTLSRILAQCRTAPEATNTITTNFWNIAGRAECSCLPVVAAFFLMRPRRYGGWAKRLISLAVRQVLGWRSQQRPGP